MKNQMILKNFVKTDGTRRMNKMKILKNKYWNVIRTIINTLTEGCGSSEKGWFWRIDEALFMLQYKIQKRQFIEDSLNKRTNKCKHNKHIGLRYFGCAWHVFCFECGESRFCAIEEGHPSGNPSREYLNNLAKKVEYI